MASKPKLLDQVRLVLRLKHMSYRTDIAYLSWIKRFILFRRKRHPKDMGAPEIRASSRTSLSTSRSPPPPRTAP